MKYSSVKIKTLLQCLVLCVLFADTFQLEQSVELDRRQTSCDCGSKLRRRRVIGGIATEVNEYRWTVMILRKLNIGKPDATIIRLCGGALISKSFVLSAAHCFTKNMNVNELFIDAGDHDLSRQNEAQSVEIAVSRLILHENFDAKAVHNDIALLRLAKQVSWTQNIQQACLPPMGMDLQNTMVTVCGWGATEEAGPGSDVLMAATIPVISLRACQAKYAGTQAIIDTSTICAGAPDGSQDACQGDSGGPLIYECNGRFTLVGVVSFGIGCGDPDFIGVYTNVSYFRDWIISNTAPATDLCGWNCRPPKVDKVDCGWPKTQARRKRIVGGDFTTANEYPWMVSMFAKQPKETSFTFTCAATLLNKEWLLTTAKCVTGYAMNDVMFILGEYDVDDILDPLKQVVTPKKFVLHPRYNNPFGSNDIALVQLNEIAKFNSTIGPICIPTADSISTSITKTVLKLLGFGRTSSGGPFSGRLKEIDLQTIETSTCKSFYGIVTDNMICTVSTPQSDACQGDSGGPLMMKDRLGRYFQLAIQSSVYGRGGVPICGSGNPTINTRIGPYVSWIEDQTGIDILKPANKLPPI